MWKEWKETGRPLSLISDELSYAIVKLNEELQNTSLWNNVPLRKVVLTEAFPPDLLQIVGLDTLMERIPEPYVKSIFGSYLSSRFTYSHGMHPSNMAFFEFLSPYVARVATEAAKK